ncbi:MAG TPA: alcohol dehydrogenase, partial [Spirochaetota bacterium]|nr:alcohol dehydrogenase [Spirochaetota bacterium]
MSNYFEFYNPVKICSGQKSLSNLTNELESLNAKKPLIITDKGVEKAGLLKPTKEKNIVGKP